MRRGLGLSLTLAALVAAFGCLATVDKDQLKQVDQQIKETRQTIARQKAERQQLQGNLKKIDTEIGKLSAELERLGRQQGEQQQQRQQLQQQLDKLRAESKAQQALLVKQLRAAYASGEDDYLKMLLNLQSLGEMERMMGYYQRFNDARLDQLKELKATKAQLQGTQQQLDRALARLASLSSQAKERQQSLAGQKQQRQGTIDKLSRQIQNQSSELEQLVGDRNALNQLIKEAERKARLRAGTQTLKGQEGKLAWPVDGRVQKLFGKNRAAGIEWKGVIINAAEGAKVKAVAGGTVVYADWVRGFGLLLVVQHGDGYMSLYGQNQALLRGVGDEVTAGEQIALVGRSGGQNEPGLYFEIRREGQAVDPARWCR